MTKILAVASAKGGVGKTTTAINLGYALHKIGRKTIVFDGNLENPDLGLYLGIKDTSVLFNGFVKSDKFPENVIYAHKSGLQIVPGDIKEGISQERNLDDLEKFIQVIKSFSDIIIMDTSPRLNKDILKIADDLIVVATPDIVSITNALKTIKIAEENGVSVLGVVLNKVGGNEKDISMRNAEIILNTPVIGVIPYSEDIINSQYLNSTVIETFPNSESSNNYKNLAYFLNSIYK